ncbi:Solute carrier family 35 member G1 [Nymphon striatum]|nr:Solute carrier family 35 member G1 [Nymphon striatum]
MFNSVHTRHTNGFLWRDMNQNRKPDTYVMKRVNMGDGPSISTEALYKTEELFHPDCPHAAQLLNYSIYVDDLIDSVPNIQKPCGSPKRLSLHKGGFKIKCLQLFQKFSRTGEELYERISKINSKSSKSLLKKINGSCFDQTGKRSDIVWIQTSLLEMGCAAKNFPGIGILLAILSTIIFGSNNAITYISLDKLGVPMFMTFRYLFFAAIATPELVKNPDYIRLSRKDCLWMAVLVLAVGLMSYSGFSALYYISPVDSSALFNTHPLTMLIIASVFLKEKCRLYQNIVIIIIIISAVLVCQPEFIFEPDPNVDTVRRNIGLALSFASGVFSAISVAIIRNLSHVNISALNFIQGICLSAAFIAFFPNQLIFPTEPVDIIVLMFCATAGATGRLVMTAALQREEATIVNAISPLEMVVTTTLQIFLLNIIPNALTIVGCLMLTTAIMLLALREKVEAFFHRLFHNTNETDEQKELLLA